MKKILAKLALFTAINIVLALPLQAWAGNNDTSCPNQSKPGCCITDAAKSKFIITIVEEAFGEPTEPSNAINDTKDYQSIICCRVTTTATSGSGTASKTELNQGACSSCAENGKSCEEVMVILSEGGTTMIEGYIATIYKWAASLVGLIAVTVIIISGIQIAMSGGDTQAVDSGKNRIIKSISGLAVLFLSGLILYTINPNFFVK